MNHKETLWNDEESRNLLEKALENFSREIVKLSKREILSPAETKEAYSVVIQIAHDIDLAKQQLREERKKLAPHVSIGAITPSSFRSFHLQHDLPHESTETTSSIELDDISHIIHTYHFDPHTVVHWLQQTYTAIRQLYVEGKDLSVQQAIMQIIDKLPFPSLEKKDPWKDLSQSDVKNCMSTLANMGELFLKARVNSSFQHNLQPDHIISMFTSLAVQHRLACQLPKEETGVDFNTTPIYYHEFQRAFGGGNGFSDMRHISYFPHQAMQIRRLLGYFSTPYKEKIFSAYQFERVPSHPGWREIDIFFTLDCAEFALVGKEGLQPKEFEFFRTILSSPSNMAKVYEGHKNGIFARNIQDISLVSNNTQAALLLSDSEGFLLPKAYCDLRKQTLVANKLLSLKHVDDPEVLEQPRFEPDEPLFETHVAEKEGLIVCRTRLKHQTQPKHEIDVSYVTGGHSPYEIPEDPFGPFPGLYSNELSCPFAELFFNLTDPNARFASLLLRFNPDHTSNLLQQFMTMSKRSLIDKILSSFKSRKESQRQEFQNLEELKRRVTLSLDDIRDLILVASSNPEFAHITEFRPLRPGYYSLEESAKSRVVDAPPVPTLSVINTIVYFTKNFGKLDSPDWRSLLKMQLFKRENLLSLLENSPEATQQLLDFINRGYTYFASFQKQEGALFFINLSSAVQGFMKLVEEARADDPKYEPLRQLLRSPHCLSITPVLQEMESAIKDPKIKALLYREQINVLLEKPTWNPTDIQQLLEKVPFLSAHPFSKEYEDIAFQEHLLNTIQAHFSEIHALIQNSKSRAQIFNRAVHTILPDDINPEREWKSVSSGIYESTDGYRFHVLEGKIYSETKPLSTLPATILSNPDFRELFKKGETQLCFYKNSTYSFSSQEYNGDWFSIKIARRNEQIYIWRQKEGQTRRFLPQNELKDALPCYPLLQTYHRWLTDEQPPRILFTDKETDEVYAEGRVQTKEDGSLWIKEVTRSAGTKRDRLVNIYTGITPFHFLEKFESKVHIALWADIHTHEPKKIELPRFGLEFVIQKREGKQVAMCVQHTGYRLSDLQYLESLGTFDQCLILEEVHNPKQKKVLIPYQEVNVVHPGSLRTDTVLDHEAFISSRPQIASIKEIPQYHEYILGRKGRLTGKTIASHLYMARILLAQKRYDDTLTYLEKFGKKVSEYTKEEFMLLFDIIYNQDRPGNTSTDHDPRAVALRLYAAHLLHANSEAYSTIDEAFKSLPRQENPLLYSVMVDTLERTYQSEQGNIGRFALTPKEHQALQQSIDQLEKKKTEEEKRLPRAFDLCSEICLRTQFHTKSSFSIIPLENFVRPFFSDLSKNFLGYYAQARHGSTQEKNELVELLHFIKTNPNPYIQGLRLTLLAVVQHPRRFPNTIKERKDVENIFSLGLPKTFPSIVPPLRKEHSFPLRGKELIAQKPSTTPLQPKEILSLSPIVPEEVLSQLFRELPQRPLVSSSEQEYLLHQLQAPQDSSHLLQEEMANVRSAISAFLASPQQKQRVLSHITEPQELPRDIEALTTSTKQLLAEEKTLAKRLEKTILELANKKPLELQEHLLANARRLGQTEKTLTIDDVILLFLHQESESYTRANPTLTPKEIQMLNQSIGEYLVLKTHIQQIKRSLEIGGQIQQLVEGQKAMANEAILFERTQALFAQLTQKRAFLPFKHPECLVFEYFSKIMLREDQVQSIEKLSNPATSPQEKKESQRVVRMLMGAGKTKVLLPIISLRKANKKQLSVLVAPEALEPTMFDDLTESARAAFEQRISRLTFDRNTPCTQRKLTQIYNELARAMKEGDSVLTTSKSIQCLRLKLIESILNASEKDISSLKVVEKLRYILDILGDNGNAIVDEIHKVAYCRHEVRFPIQEKQPLTPQHREISIELYKTLLSNPALQQQMTFSFLRGGNEQAPLFTPEAYSSFIKRPLAEQLLNRLIKRENIDRLILGELSQFLEDHRTNLPDLLDYLCDNSQADQKKGKSIVDQSPVSIQNLFGIIRGQLNTIFLLTFKTKCDERYGFDQDLLTPLSIPYVANNIPKPEEEFGNPYEILDYTIQQYLRKGIPLDIFKRQIHSLKESAISKVSNGQYSTLFKTPEYEQLKWLLQVPQETLLQMSDMDNEEWIESRHAQWTNLLDILEYGKKYVLPLVTFDGANIHDTPQGFLSCFSLRQGLTGTPSNKETYPEDMYTEDSPIVEGKSAFYIWQQSKNTPPLITSLKTPQETVQAVLSTKSDAFIDIGSVLNGVPNQQAARLFLKEIMNDPERSHIQGVVFFDAQDKQVILKRGETKASPFKGCGVPAEEYYTYYDQFHTTGSDIKQKVTGLGSVSVGKDTTLTDLFQACWRMRGLEGQQKLRFLLSKEVANLIRLCLGLSKTTPLEWSHIFLYTKLVETNQQQKDNLLATKQKIEQAIQSCIYTILFRDPSIPLVKAVTFFNTHFQDFFVQKQTDSPFLQYGSLSQETDIREHLDHFIKEKMVRFQKAVQELKDPTIQQRFNDSQPNLMKTIDHSIHYKFLPPTAKADPPVLLNQTVEVLKAVQKETQKETSLELEESYFPGNPAPCPYRTWTNPTEVSPRIDIHKPAFLETEVTATGVFGRLWRALSSPIRPRPLILTMPDILSSVKGFSSYAPLFSPSLTATYNVCPIQKYSNKMMREKPYISSQLPYEPFGLRTQVPAQQLLVIKKGNDCRVILLDQADATFFYQQLSKERDDPPSTTQPSEQICLYDLTLGVLQYGKSPMTTEELRSNPHFMELLVQSKFFNGEILYDTKEMEALKQWLGHDKEKKEKAMELFEKKILAHHPQKQAEYQKSRLRAFFHESTTKTIALS